MLVVKFVGYGFAILFMSLEISSGLRFELHPVIERVLSFYRFLLRFMEYTQIAS